jgi:hypothetical protein
VVEAQKFGYKGKKWKRTAGLACPWSLIANEEDFVGESS